MSSDILRCLSHTVEQLGQLLHVSSMVRPDALRNCWKRLLQWGQLSGDLKLKGAGGCKRIPLLAIVLVYEGFDHGLDSCDNNIIFQLNRTEQ